MIGRLKQLVSSAVMGKRSRPADGSFDQADYWRKRHRKLKGDPRSVGNLGADLEANQRMEVNLAASAGRIAGALAQEGKSSVLDIGCGYGRATSAFLEHGFDYTGLDVSDDAVAQARERHPGARFEQQDLLRWKPGKRYDAVLCLYVLVHFVDDADWERLLANLAGSLAPGGVLAIADVFPEERVKGGDHVVTRPFADYEARFDRLGLTLDDALHAKAFSEDAPAGEPFRLLRAA